MAPKKITSCKCMVGVTPADCESCGGLYSKVIHLKSNCAYALHSDGSVLIGEDGEPVFDDADKLHWMHKESDTRVCENCTFLHNMQRLA